MDRLNSRISDYENRQRELQEANRRDLVEIESLRGLNRALQEKQQQEEIRAKQIYENFLEKITNVTSRIVSEGGRELYSTNKNSMESILAPMKEGRPFEGGISDKIRTLGWIVLVGGAVVEIGRMISAVLELQAYDLSMITENPMVESVTYNYSISLWFVVTALILFFLSHIFRYGEVLQQESDETL